MADEIMASEDQRIFEALAAVASPPSRLPPMTRENVQQMFRHVADAATRSLQSAGWAADQVRQVFRSSPADNPSRLRGQTFHMAMIDEMAHFQPRPRHDDLAPMSMGSAVPVRADRHDDRVPVLVSPATFEFFDVSWVQSPPPGSELRVHQTADEPRHGPAVGWVMEETMGMAVVNTRGLRALELSTVSTPADREAVGRRVMVPEFEMGSNPTVRVEDVRARRFDLRGTRSKANLLAQALIDRVVAHKLAARVVETLAMTGPSFREELYGPV